MSDKPKTYAEDTMTTVPLRAIIKHEDVNYRDIDTDHVKELTASISRNGLDTPITVWNGGSAKGEVVELEGGKSMPATFLIAGHHRLASLKDIFKNNLDRFKELFPNGIPVVVKSGEMKDFLALQLRENISRKDMTIAQILPVVKALIDDHGMKQKEVAKAIGKSEGYISQIIDSEDEVGEEETEELAKEGASIKDLREAAKEIKKGKKEGKDIRKEVVEKTKKKVQAKKASGRQREEKRVSAKKIWQRYQVLPRGIKMGQKLDILENALGYLAQDAEFDLPKELSADVESKSDEDEDDE